MGVESLEGKSVALGFVPLPFDWCRASVSPLLVKVAAGRRPPGFWGAPCSPGDLLGALGTLGGGVWG